MNTGEVNLVSPRKFPDMVEKLNRSGDKFRVLGIDAAFGVPIVSVSPPIATAFTMAASAESALSA